MGAGPSLPTPQSRLPDLYRTLSVEPQADPEAIRAAYRRMARVYHPDLTTDPSAAERMRVINAAYAVLSDPRRRAAYDARRAYTVLSVPAVRPAPASRAASYSAAPQAVASPAAASQRTVDVPIVVLCVILVLTVLATVALAALPGQQSFLTSRRGSVASSAPSAATADATSIEHAASGDVP